MASRRKRRGRRRVAQRAAIPTCGGSRRARADGGRSRVRPTAEVLRHGPAEPKPGMPGRRSRKPCRSRQSPATASLRYRSPSSRASKQPSVIAPREELNHATCCNRRRRQKKGARDEERRSRRSTKSSRQKWMNLQYPYCQWLAGILRNRRRATAVVADRAGVGVLANHCLLAAGGASSDLGSANALGILDSAFDQRACVCR